MTDTTPLITGVDFVCIPAQDFDAMTAFYGETLGLPFVKRYGTRAGAEYQAGNLTLAIMRTEDFGGTFSPNAMPIALQVADVAAARQQLEARGVRFVSETFDSGVCWQAICLDPDGNPLSLHHRYAPEVADAHLRAPVHQPRGEGLERWSALPCPPSCGFRPPSSRRRLSHP